MKKKDLHLKERQRLKSSGRFKILLRLEVRVIFLHRKTKKQNEQKNNMCD